MESLEWKAAGGHNRPWRLHSPMRPLTDVYRQQPFANALHQVYRLPQGIPFAYRHNCLRAADPLVLRWGPRRRHADPPQHARSDAL